MDQCQSLRSGSQKCKAEKKLKRNCEETEKKLKEELYMAKNQLAIKQDARRKEIERRENGGLNGGQKNSNRR